MQQPRFWYAKCVLIVSLLAMTALPAAARARGRYKKSSGVQHYITVSLSGGEGNTMTQTVIDRPRIHNRIGADGQLHLGYELRQKGFFFGVGVGADYDLGRQHIDSLKDVYARIDRENDEVRYTYAYRDYNDMQQSLRLSIPVYIGGYITEELYLLGGVKLGLQMWNSHYAETELETYGTYVDFVHTIHHAEFYGYYPEGHYTYTGAYPASSLTVTPMAEIGYKIPLETKSKRVEMRVGAYAEYVIPLSQTNSLAMTDISKTDINPFTQNKENLHSHIILNAPVTTGWQENGKTCNLQVGVRLTCLFNVTPPKKFCMCNPDRKIGR